MLFLGIAPTLALIAVVPGLLTITLFGYFLAIVLGPFCLRFRDVTQVIASAMGIAFFLTPVLWMREQGRVPAAVVDWNPLYHLLELVRAPLMGSFPTAANWTVGLGLVAAAGLLAVITLSMTRKRIYLWL
jgi:lipopolysaccharide transport system permease protein